VSPRDHMIYQRGEIVWADLGPEAGRKPVCVLTRDAAIPLLDRVTCAPITLTIRGIASEVELGPEHGLPDRAVINCDNIITLPKVDLDPRAVRKLDIGTRAVLDRALRYSPDIIF
jgi:mRNA interferase MazF